MHSPSPTTRATSPAATRTTPLRMQLAAKEPAVRGNARRLEPRFVPPGIALMTPEPVILSSATKQLMIKEGEDQLQLTQGVTWDGAPMLITSAELGSIRIVVTIQTVSSGEEEKLHVHGSTTSLVMPNY